jgi:glycosyltransferase involved in cell wall biosynthesis
VALAGGRSLQGIRRRIELTYRYLGLRTMLWRMLSFPLRFTPLRGPLKLGTPAEQHLYRASRWQRREGPRVTVVAPGEPLRAAPGHDLAVLDRGIRPSRKWLAAMQYAAHRNQGTPIVTGRIIGADGTIESAGLCQDAQQRDRAVGRYRGRPAAHSAAQVEGSVLAAAEEWAFVRADALGDGGSVAELSLRAWERGHETLYLPSVAALRKAGAARTPSGGLGGLAGRPVHTPDGKLRIAYVTQATSVGGGHRDIFEHLNRMQARGHDVSLYSLGGQPDWFPLDVQVKTFPDWDALTAALAGEDAIKIATWWRSAMPVWRATRNRGVPVYFVQDIETSYYPDDPASQARVLDTYRNEFRYMTISGYNREGLAEMGLNAEIVAPGIDLDSFRPLGRERREDMLLALGRGNHLKNLDLTIDAWKALDGQRPEMCLFGIEPELGARHGARYVTAPSDEEVNELFNEATIFLQTSLHEGFALPPLEAMATGGAVITTDAHGNRDFCRDGENCLMPEPTVESVRGAIERLLGDPALRRRLGEEGIRTAQDYAWERRIDSLEVFLEAASRPYPDNH